LGFNDPTATPYLGAPANGGRGSSRTRRRSHPHELTRDNLTQDERTYIQESRWWSLDNPGLRRIRVFPEDFVDAAGSVLRDGRPAAAQWLR
jgi:hypothetical protein